MFYESVFLSHLEKFLPVSTNMHKAYYLKVNRTAYWLDDKCSKITVIITFRKHFSSLITLYAHCKDYSFISWEIYVIPDNWISLFMSEIVKLKLSWKNVIHYWQLELQVKCIRIRNELELYFFCDNNTFLSLYFCSVDMYECRNSIQSTYAIPVNIIMLY